MRLTHYAADGSIKTALANIPDHTHTGTGAGGQLTDAALSATVGVAKGGTGANLSATGGSGQYVKQTSSGGAFTVGTIPGSDVPAKDYIVLRDVQTSGTGAGGFTSGAWQTRVLNTEVVDSGNNCSLSSNQFTLAAGTYYIFARAPGFACSRHQVRIQNVTDATTVLEGTNANAANTDTTQTDSFVEGVFTVAASKALELQHRCSVTSGTNGLGLPCSFTNEIYATVYLIRLS